MMIVILVCLNTLDCISGHHGASLLILTCFRKMEVSGFIVHLHQSVLSISEEPRLCIIMNHCVSF